MPTNPRSRPGDNAIPPGQRHNRVLGIRDVMPCSALHPIRALQWSASSPTPSSSAGTPTRPPPRPRTRRPAGMAPARQEPPRHGPSVEPQACRCSVLARALHQPPRSVTITDDPRFQHKPNPARTAQNRSCPADLSPSVISRDNRQSGVTWASSVNRSLEPRFEPDMSAPSWRSTTSRRSSEDHSRTGTAGPAAHPRTACHGTTTTAHAARNHRQPGTPLRPVHLRHPPRQRPPPSARPRRHKNCPVSSDLTLARGLCSLRVL